MYLSPSSGVIYAYNGAALEIFRSAKRMGLTCVMDQTAASWRYNTDLLSRELEGFSDWESRPSDLDDTGRMISREEAEWELADGIICGSQFVVDSIRQSGGPYEKCRVVPYPIPDVGRSGAENSVESVTSEVGDGIRGLYLGTLQLRKGIQYLWQASEVAPDISYRAIGPSNLTPLGNDIVKKALGWRGSVTRSSVGSVLRAADVFVLPTLSEGSANVCLEALAVGIPVVTTEASGIPPRPGVTFVPSKDPTAINLAVRQAYGSSMDSQVASRSIADYGRDLIDAIDGVSVS